MVEKSGLETLRETANGIKVRAEEERRIANAQSAIASANLSAEAMAYLNRHATTGAEDLNTGVSVPQLRIHSVGVSTKNVLADGSDPEDGDIFHTGLQIAGKSMRVILLAIKKCRLEQVDDAGNIVVDSNNKPILKAHYLLAGVLDEGLEPFVIYVKGMSYNKIWDLEDQLKPYVTKRAGGIPLSMLKVDVSSKKEVVEQGKYKGQKKNVFQFSLVMHESGEFPLLENDGKRLELLEDSTVTAENMLDQIVMSKGLSEKEFNAEKKSQQLVETVKEQVLDGETVDEEPDFSDSDTSEVEDVADDVPF